MPHSDAASRKHPGLQSVQAAYSGCRIGVRHDGYRPPGLEEDAILIFVHEAVHPNCGRTSFIGQRPSTALQKTAFYRAKGGLLACERRPFTDRKTTFCKAVGNALIYKQLQITPSPRWNECTSGCNPPAKARGLAYAPGTIGRTAGRVASPLLPSAASVTIRRRVPVYFLPTSTFLPLMM